MLKKAKDAILRLLSICFVSVSATLLRIPYQLIEIVWYTVTLIMIMTCMLYHKAIGAMCRMSGDEYDWVEEAKEGLMTFKAVFGLVLEKFK